MSMNQQNLIKLLKDILDNSALDYHNETTYAWSKGYRKAILDIINTIEYNKKPTI